MLGQIATAFVHGNEARRRAFMELIKSGVADFFENHLDGALVEFPEEQPAPEHERAGHG